MNRLVAIIIILSSLLLGETPNLNSMHRQIGTKEIRASCQVKIIIPGKKEIDNAGECDSLKIKKDSLLKSTPRQRR
ncbi:MAG: hypothetical protein ABIL39_00920 [candidate division WOR-3 bacterium]